MAVIGVSSKKRGHPANVIYSKSNFRYPIKVFPVNPHGGMLYRENIYTKLSELPEKVDLAVIAARAQYVPEIIKSCIQNEVGGAVIISGGFAEIGITDLQEHIVSMAKEASFPFIGPNCLGICSPPDFDTFFLPSERLIQPRAGNVAFVSQSGGVLVDQMAKFAGQNIGVSLAVSIGNKALIKEIDLLKYLSE
eukprot:CAMPEP_0201283724 /NCGR_PEP_ID=MMETSP1317-20130820/43886_1 /ASSEMBLY_ACC=CAM_ASM_000770 /TAXON_ID=187299 /ORGANISM="Undescribed Undescribed, Strain Undescribed" /LENGTH=192 /DNA_ID=CAMNT_0047601089 /DNA_START=136 /DNA_END=711 /DNA_ORIENTATION=-